jgi:hypothetical protein
MPQGCAEFFLPPQAAELVEVDEEVSRLSTLGPHQETIDRPDSQRLAGDDLVGVGPRDPYRSDAVSVFEPLPGEHEASAERKEEEIEPEDKAEEPVEPGVSGSQASKDPEGAEEDDRRGDHENESPVPEVEDLC